MATTKAEGSTAGGGKTLKQVERLIAELRETQARACAITEEIQRLLGGGVPLGETLKALEQAFDAAWCQRWAPGQTGRYLWNYQRDRAQLKRLLGVMTPEQIKARFLVYIRNDDPFFLKARHAFGLFVSSVNQHVPQTDMDFALESEAPTVADCRHQPPCRTDQEHTTRKLAEMRGLF